MFDSRQSGEVSSYIKPRNRTPYFTQKRFPFLWTIFQVVIGGVKDKRKFALCYYSNSKRVLEVGCSVGLISDAFKAYKNVCFTGIDIDPIVIERAKKRFSDFPNFRFMCVELCEFAKAGQQFDHVIFPGILHHVDDQTIATLLAAGLDLLAPEGRLIVIDPVLPSSSDPWWYSWYIALDQGEYLRDQNSLRHILENIPRLKIMRHESRHMAATPLGVPKCARFDLYECASNLR